MSTTIHLHHSLPYERWQGQTEASEGVVDVCVALMPPPDDFEAECVRGIVAQRVRDGLPLNLYEERLAEGRPLPMPPLAFVWQDDDGWRGPGWRQCHGDAAAEVFAAWGTAISTPPVLAVPSHPPDPAGRLWRDTIPLGEERHDVAVVEDGEEPKAMVWITLGGSWRPAPMAWAVAIFRAWGVFLVKRASAAA